MRVFGRWHSSLCRPSALQRPALPLGSARARHSSRLRVSQRRSLYPLGLRRPPPADALPPPGHRFFLGTRLPPVPGPSHLPLLSAPRNRALLARAQEVVERGFRLGEWAAVLVRLEQRAGLLLALRAAEG